MRRTILILSALALTSGVAVADRSHGNGGGSHVSQAGRGHASVASHSSHVAERDHRGGGVYGGGRIYGGGGGRVYNGGNRFVGRDYRTFNGGRWDRNAYRGYYFDRGYYRPWSGVHYYDYSRRPTIIVENFAPMAGYGWIAGSWQWDGSEWMWYPGHYEANLEYGY